MQNVPNRAAGEAVSAVSRRAFLRTTASAGIATAAAGGALAVEVAAASAAHPDSELIALGAAFDRAFAAYKPLSVRANEAADAFQKSRLPDLTGGKEAKEAYWRDYERDVDPFIEEANAAAKVADDLAITIRAIPVRTLAGVAVKARTLRHDLCKWGDSSEPLTEWDWDDECLELFIRDIERAGGGLV